MKYSSQKTTTLIPILKNSLQKKDYKDVLDICSEIELLIEENESDADMEGGVDHFFCCYMSSYLITGDLDGARFLWRRLPAILKSKQYQIAGLWNIGKSLWLQDFPSLRSCFSIEWSENVLFLVHDIRASVYNRNVKQISEAYSVLSFKTFCEMLMLDRQEAEEACGKLGWEIDNAREYVHPKPIVTSVISEDRRTFLKDTATLQQLSSYVANFEKKPLKVDTNASGGTSSSGTKKAVGY